MTAFKNWSSERKWKIMRQIEKRDSGWNCHYCNKKMILLENMHTLSQYGETINPNFKDHPTIDHKVPQSKGGSNGLDNLVLCCRSCNAKKKDKPYAEYH